MESWIITIVQEKKCLVDLTLREKSTRSEVFSKKVVLRNFAKFTGKHLCQLLFFNKVVGMRPATLLKKRLWHSCFPVNFTKFLRTPFLTEHLWWLLLERACAMLFRWLKFNLNLVRNFKPKWFVILKRYQFMEIFRYILCFYFIKSIKTSKPPAKTSVTQFLIL